MTDKNEKKPLGLKGKLTINKNLSDLIASEDKNRSRFTVQIKRKRVAAPPEELDSINKASQLVETKSTSVKKGETSEQKGKFTSSEWEARMRVLRQAENVEKEMAERRLTEEDQRKKLQKERLDTQQEKEVDTFIKEQNELTKKKEEKKTIDEKKPAVIEKKSIAELEAEALRAAPSKKTSKTKGVTEKDLGAKKEDKKAAIRTENQRRQSKKVNVETVLEEEESALSSIFMNQRGAAPQPSLVKKTPPKKKGSAKKPGTFIPREVILPETITVSNLANRMAIRASAVIKKLMQMGTVSTTNQVIDTDTAELLVQEFGHKIKNLEETSLESLAKASIANPENLQTRPPVVTIMGHVDHGKTSLLDALRKTDVVGGEAGGITQHIGAYQITLLAGKKITFIDTPGHAAFSEMRSRGANVTDIVILVVAADDGIKEQTIEAINHAKAAGVPIIVAINKIDKQDANPDRIRQDLLNQEIIVESMGGDVLEIEVSALKGTNLDKLEEAILLQAELLDLKASSTLPAQGVVIESRLERGRGIVATILIQQGTLQKSNIFVSGSTFGRVRSLSNDHNKKIEYALPSMPIEITGFDNTPQAGDLFLTVPSEPQAREISITNAEKIKKQEKLAQTASSLEDLFAKAAQGSLKELPIIIKTNVHGSLEALKSSLEKLSSTEVAVNIIHSAVGGVSASDISLAQMSGAFVLAFNVRADTLARDAALKNGIDIRYYAVIYDAINDVKDLLSGLLAPIERENFLGYAEIRQVFSVTKVGKIAGCMVTQGTVKRGCKVRLLRDNIVIHEGSLKSLKRFKDEVTEAREGFECGLALEHYNDIKEADVIECFEVEEIARTLD